MPTKECIHTSTLLYVQKNEELFKQYKTCTHANNFIEKTTPLTFYRHRLSMHFEYALKLNQIYIKARSIHMESVLCHFTCKNLMCFFLFTSTFVQFSALYALHYRNEFSEIFIRLT